MNRLLKAVPARDYAKLAPHLREKSFPTKHNLVHGGDPIYEVYFPVDAVISVLKLYKIPDGGDNFMEMATIGNEGMFGVTAALGQTRMNPRDWATVQVGGAVTCLDVKVFLQEMQKKSSFSALVLHYVQAFLAEVGQQVVCNAVHPVEKRAARWLLLTHDRVDSNEFPMTQEFLAQMLGVRRATVTLASRGLRENGVIKFFRGKVTVLDRKGLEQAACECYGITREVFDRVLPGR